MAQFNASTAVEALEFDFTQYVPNCSGVIPEPSTEQIQNYFNEARDVAKSVMAIKSKAEALQGTDADEMDEAAVADLVTDLDSLDIDEIQQRMIVLISDLCSNVPTVEQITALPFRVRQEFIKWVGTQFRS